MNGPHSSIPVLTRHDGEPYNLVQNMIVFGSVLTWAVGCSVTSSDEIPFSEFMPLTDLSSNDFHFVMVPRREMLFLNLDSDVMNVPSRMMMIKAAIIKVTPLLLIITIDLRGAYQLLNELINWGEE